MNIRVHFFNSNFLAIFAVVVLLSACSSIQPNNSTQDTPATTESKSDQSVQEAIQDQPTKIVQTPIHLKNLSYLINSVDSRQSVETKYGSTVSAPANWTYLVVKYSVKNNAHKSTDVWTENFELTTSDGTIYEKDSSATSALSSGLLSQLHPGAQYSNVIVFQVPVDALEKEPLMHIGLTEGGWSIAAVPLVNWHGQVLFQPGAENVGNHPPKLIDESLSSPLYVCNSKSSYNSVDAYDCPDAARNQNSDLLDSSQMEGLGRRCMLSLSPETDVVRIIEKDGDTAKVLVVASRSEDEKGRVGWVTLNKLRLKGNALSESKTTIEDNHENQKLDDQSSNSQEQSSDSQESNSVENSKLSKTNKEAEDNVAPNNTDSVSVIESILKSEQDSDAAEVEIGFKKLNTLKPLGQASSPDAISANDKGLAELRNGNSEGAIALLQEAITLNPTNSKYFNNLGLAELNAGQLDSAQMRFKKSITLEPNKTIAWGNLGIALAKQGKRELAVSSLLVAAKTSKEKTLKFINELDYEDELVQSVAKEALVRIDQ